MVTSRSACTTTAVVSLLVAVFSSSVQCYERLTGNGNELLFNPEFEYESDFRHDLEHDLLPHEERSYFYHGEPEAEHVFHHTDYSLANLRPISPTPAFTLDPSYISPADIVPARAKRANRIRRKPSSKQRKREQKESDRDDDEDEEDEEEMRERNGQGNSGESTDVDDYAERYEQFIAKHFEDLDNKRKKSASQRRASKRNRKPSNGDANDEDDDDDDDEKQEDGDYKFDRFDYSSSEDYERIKAESEEQSRQLAKDPGNCRTYEKDGMVCSVCHDPASDSASESCAYATEPHHRKYAYVKERNYDSKKDDPNRAKATEHDGEANDHDEDDEADREHTSAETRPERQTDIGASLPAPTPVPKRIPSRPLRKPALRTKPHQSATNGGGYRYQPIDLRSNRANMKLTVAADSANLPPAGKGEDIYVMDYADQDEVAKVLAEFKARDWSNCRKGKRMDDGELTCYQCTDAAGVNHEECMYVSESRQIASAPVRPPPSMTGGKLRKRKKVVALTRKDLAAIEPVPANAANGVPPPKEKQTVKRTVSFRSFVTGSGRPKEAAPLIGGSDGGERVIHYEHHISHEVP